ncbi:hypothetical protein BDZ89DRAFT_1055727 [Hymenopellis radicata]|nr:hypothetical protein BDZ89DRAFT_1055727 [Hymenopellis radicata]
MDPGAFDDFRDDLREAILQRLDALVPGNSSHLTPTQIQDLVECLPRLTEKQVIELGQKDAICPICLTPLMALLAEEEMAIAMDSPAHPIEELGVARLAQKYQCGHLFCRRDISRWIHDSHDSCPTCRRALLERSPTNSQPSTPTPTREVPPVNLNTLPPQVRDAISRLNHQMPGLFSSIFPSDGVGQPGHAADDVISPVEISELDSFFRLNSPSHNPRRDRDRDEYAGMYS